MNQLAVRILNRFKLLELLNVTGRIVLNSRKFKIPIIRKIGFENMFISEPWMTDLLKVVLKSEKRAFVDVGVNVGQTLLKLRSVDPEIKYVGFEPNPLCVFYTNNLIKENGFVNCQVIPVGISTTTDVGELNFFSELITDSSASIIPNFRPNQNIVRREYVPIFQLDQIQEKIGLRDYSVLKIDVEGAELEVIQGFYKSIEQYQPVILIEILPAYSNDNVYRIERQNEIVRLVQGLGYALFRVSKQNDKFAGVVEIENIEIHSDLDRCDYVMMPKSKKELVKDYCLR